MALYLTPKVSISIHLHISETKTHVSVVTTSAAYCSERKDRAVKRHGNETGAFRPLPCSHTAAVWLLPFKALARILCVAG